MDEGRGSKAAAILSAAAGLLFLVMVPASVRLRPLAALPTPLPANIARPASLSIAAVRAGSKQPVAGATARAFWRDGEKYLLAGTGVTDAAGRSALGELPAGAFWILVEAPGFARASTSLVLGRTREVRSIALFPAHSLSVHVSDESGQPVRDATVLVDGTDPLPFGALTDASGGAILSRLDSGPFRVRVFARGYDAETRADVRTDVAITVRAVCSLDVSVTAEDARPVASATVLVAGANLWPARSAVTAADGHVRIASLPSGAYDLRATAGTLVSKIESGVRVERGENKKVALVLRPGRMIPIVVTDGEGDHPIVVRNADVVLVEGGVSSFPLEGRTNTFGKVTLGPVADGPAVVGARASGFVERAAVPLPEELSDDFRVALVRGATLRGEVVDEKGRPVDGASIEIIGTDLDGMPIAETPVSEQFRRVEFDSALAPVTPLLARGELGVTEGPVPAIPGDSFQPSPLASAMALAPDAIAPWVTNLDGTFRATPVPPGRVRALVRHPAFVEGLSDLVTLGPGGEASVRVVLDEGGSIEGTVVDESGVPVAGARVEVAAIEGTLNRAVTAASDGTFAFAAVPKDVFVSLARADEPYKPVVRRRLTVDDGKKTEIELVLPAPRPEIEITVSDDSGRPVPLAQVSALSLDPDQLLRSTEFTGNDGRVVIRDAQGLALRLIVEVPGYARFTNEYAVAPEKVSVELASAVTIEGHVTAVRGRRDVEGASVEVLAEGHRKVAFTDASGLYRIGDLAPGKIHIAVSHPDYATVEKDVEVASTGRADRAFDVDAIDLAEPGSVAGTVVDKAGKPVAGVRVGVGPISTYVPVGSNPEGTATTAADGSFRLARVRPGLVTIEAYAPDVGRGRAPNVVVESDRTAEGISIRLEPGDDVDSTATGGVAITLMERDQNGEKELVVRDVAPGSEAEHSGILDGDVILSVDKASPTSLGDARRRLSGPDGSDVVIRIQRSGASLSFRVARERVRR